jgi:hypothetical protein
MSTSESTKNEDVQASDAVPEKGTKKQDYLVKLRQVLARRFDTEELRTLCFNLSIDYDDLPSGGKDARARELVKHFERRNDLSSLIEAVKQLHPGVTLGEIPEKAKKVSPEPLPQKIVIPPRRVYTKSEFVGRREELDAVKRRASQGKKGEDIDQGILNFWGIEGTGKTWLMRHLAQRYRGPGRLNKGESKRTFVAFLDFVNFDLFEWTAPNLAALLKPAVEDVLEQTGDVAPEATMNLQDSLEAAMADQETTEGLGQSFVDWIQDLTGQFVPLVLLDAIERATAETLSKIEVQLLEPLASTDRVILVTAGRREVARWRRFAVRRRQAKPIELQAFTVKETARQIEKQGFELPGELIYAYSFGLAYASQVMASAIREISNSREADEQSLRENESCLGLWLAALEDHLLEHVPPATKEALHKLCVLRTIRQGVVTWLLALKNEDEFRHLLNDLENTRLVWWQPKRGTYLMAPPLRRLLNLRLRLQEPDTFTQRHRRAADFYSDATTKRPYDCGPLFVEALYNTTYGYPNQLPKKLDELLAQTLEPDNFTIGGVEFLLDQLRQDDELRDALSVPLTERVVQSVQDLYHNVKRVRLSAS